MQSKPQASDMFSGEYFTFWASKFLWKPDTLLSCMISENCHYSNALGDLQKNSGVLSEGFVLGNLGLGLWQAGVGYFCLASLWRGRRQWLSTPKWGAAPPLCDNAGPTKVNKARGASVTKGGTGGPGRWTAATPVWPHNAQNRASQA